MCSIQWFGRCLQILLLLVLAAAPARADINQRASYFGPITNGTVFQCAPGWFLVGINENKTDRMIGVSVVCAEVVPGKRWKSADDVGVAGWLGDPRHGEWQNSDCAPNSFLVGFTATVGTYVPDTHGLAVATPPDLLADLASVCRDGTAHSVLLPSGHNKNAENNNLRVIRWDGDTGGRTCRQGEAAIGVIWSYYFAPNADPNNRFSDVALLCDRLPLSAKDMDLDKVHRKATPVEMGAATIPPKKPSPIQPPPPTRH